MTVSELSSRMTPQEFLAWQVVFNHKPFGEMAADGRVLDSILFQANLNRKKGSPAKKFLHFIDRTIRSVRTKVSQTQSNNLDDIAAQFDELSRYSQSPKGK